MQNGWGPKNGRLMRRVRGVQCEALKFSYEQQTIRESVDFGMEMGPNAQDGMCKEGDR